MGDVGDRGFDSANLSRAFRAERNQALHRVFRRLPGEFIAGLIAGLEEADVITPGKLFAGRSGGCAVGVTLRVLDPSSYDGRWVMWGRSCSILGFRRRLARQIPYLYALEQVFDRSVVLAAERFPAAPPEQVAKAVALWVADEARTELALRELVAEWVERSSAESAGPARQPAPAATAPALALV